MISHLLELKDERAFDIILTSRCYRHRFDCDGKRIENFTRYFIKTIIRWSMGVLISARDLRSHYIPVYSGMSNMFDLVLLHGLYDKIIKSSEFRPEIYTFLLFNIDSHLLRWRQDLYQLMNDSFSNQEILKSLIIDMELASDLLKHENLEKARLLALDALD